MKRFIHLILLVLLCTVGLAQQRIVSLAPSLTQNLYLLGLENEVVGYTNYCEEAVHSGKTIVASAIKVNLEKVAVLQPSLVLTTTLTTPETIKQLESLGIKVEVFPSADSYVTMQDQFLKMAQLTQTEAKAKEILMDCSAKIALLQEKIDPDFTPSVFFQIGTSPLYCVSPTTFMDDYIKMAGGTNIITEPRCGAVTRESILVKNPDVIFVTTMGIQGDDEKKTWASYKDISASQHQRIFLVESNKACSPTPITFVETLETMIGYLYP